MSDAIIPAQTILVSLSTYVNQEIFHVCKLKLPNLTCLFSFRNQILIEKTVCPVSPLVMVIFLVQVCTPFRSPRHLLLRSHVVSYFHMLRASSQMVVAADERDASSIRWWRVVDMRDAAKCKSWWTRQTSRRGHLKSALLWRLSCPPTLHHFHRPLPATAWAC